jgi:hypothetical protein
MDGVMELNRGRVDPKITTMPSSANDVRYEVFTHTAFVTAIGCICPFIGRAAVRHETHFGMLLLPWLDHLLINATQSVDCGVLRESQSDYQRCTATQGPHSAFIVGKVRTIKSLLRRILSRGKMSDFSWDVLLDCTTDKDGTAPSC